MVEKTRSFIKYLLRGKFIFGQLIMNFTDFRQNNGVFMKKKINKNKRQI